MEARIKKLEKTVQQQGYLIYTMMVIFPFLVGAVLLLWGQQGPPDFDHIAVSLSVFQTFFGVAAFAGFWALRGLTKETAQDVAEAEIKKIAAPLVLREVQDSLQNLPKDTISDLDLSQIVSATGDAGKEGDDGK